MPLDSETNEGYNNKIFELNNKGNYTIFVRQCRQDNRNCSFFFELFTVYKNKT